jgi:hypothetical protein
MCHEILLLRVSGKINFNFGPSATFLSKSGVKISQFVFSKIHEVLTSVSEIRGKKSTYIFGENAPIQPQCSSQRRGLALRFSCNVFPVARQVFLSMKIRVRWLFPVGGKTFLLSELFSHSDRTFTGKIRVNTVMFSYKPDRICFVK